VIGRGDASASEITQGGVVVTGSVFFECQSSNGSVEGAVRVVLECPVTKSAVAESAGGISKCLKTDGSANTKLFVARGPGSKTMERLKAERGVGAGNGVVLERLLADCHVGADLEAQDVVECAASPVVKKRVGPNGGVAAGSVAIERKGAHRGVVFAGGIIDKSGCSIGCI